MKKLLACILIAFMLLTMLVSCKDDKNDDGGSGDTKENSGSPSSESKIDGSENTDDGSEGDASAETADTVAGKTPLEAYKQAFAKVNAMTAYDLEINTQYEYTYDGTTEDTTNILEVYRTDGATAYYNTKYNDSDDGEYWYVGETMYSNSNGIKEKNVVSNDDYKQNYAIKSSDVMLSIRDSAFDGKKFEIRDEVYYVTVEATPSEYAAFSGITVGENAACEIGFDKDGNIVSLVVKAVYAANSGIIMDITRSVNYKKLSDVAATTAPTDADSYRSAPAEDSLDKTAIEGVDKVSVTDEKTDLVMIDVEGYGKIIVRLYPTVAPKTVENFQKLVSEGYYDGVIFHRVIKDFMIQGGDGEKGDGTGGSPDKIAGEFTSNGFANNLTHKRGVISMARTNDPDSASSQFFIVHKDSPHLNGQYASFGYVVCGMDVVDAIASVETDANDKPTTEVKMNSIKFVKVN